jgi:nitroreductase
MRRRRLWSLVLSFAYPGTHPTIPPVGIAGGAATSQDSIASRITNMTNPVFETVRTVLAVREFDDQPIPDDLLRRIVEAGHLTASSLNLQPWHFVVVTVRDRLRELGGLIGTGRYIASAGAAIVVAYERDSEYGVSDASRAIQSMILVAWAEGVGSNWTGFGGLDSVGAKVGIPDTYEVLAVVPFGYPKRKLGKGKKKRKPLTEIASAETFKNPIV